MEKACIKDSGAPSEIEIEAEWRPTQNGRKEFDGAINLARECKCQKGLVENNYNQAYFSCSRTRAAGQQVVYC